MTVSNGAGGTSTVTLQTYSVAIGVAGHVVATPQPQPQPQPSPGTNPGPSGTPGGTPSLTPKNPPAPPGGTTPPRPTPPLAFFNHAIALFERTLAEIGNLLD